MANDILNNPFKKNSLAVILLTTCFAMIFIIEKKTRLPPLKLSPQETTIHFNEHLVKALSLGQYRFASSLLWAETMLRSDIEHYKTDDLNNWMYRRLNLITTLDPYFYQAYLYGGMYLSVIKDDDEGARLIYERGLRNYPYDLYLCLNAGFHYHFELSNYPKAISVYKRIVDHPNAPSHIPSLLARLQSEVGSLSDAFQTLSTIYKTLPNNPILKKRIVSQLYAIKAELDLDCLENNKGNCKRMDFDNRPYLYLNGKWAAQKNWTPYRIKKRAPIKEPSSKDL